MAELEIYLLKKNNRVNREILELIDKNIPALKRSCRIQIFLENHKDGKIPKDREKKLRKRGIIAWPTLINNTTRKMLNDDEMIIAYIQELIGKARVQRKMPDEDIFAENYHDIAAEIMSDKNYEDEDDEKKMQEEYAKNMARYTKRTAKDQVEQQEAERAERTPRRERITVDEPYDDGFDDDAMDIMQRLNLEDD